MEEEPVSRIRIVGIVLIFIAAGCASARRGIGDNLTVEKMDTLAVGKTTASRVKALFGRPDLVKNLKSGEVEYTYLQGKSGSVGWQVFPGYRIYGSADALSGSVILLLRFRDGVLVSFIATNGRLTIQKGNDTDSDTEKKKEEEGK